MNPTRQTNNKIAPEQIKEGKITKRIENQTAKIPSIFFLNLALAGIVLSAGLALNKRTRPAANFVGLWPPTFLLLGIYNKLVKLEGNDRSSGN